MKRITRKLLALGYLCSIGIATSGLTATVHALPSQEVTTTYYSDASKTTEVGEFMLLCNGQRMQWGKRTRYGSRSSSPCNGGGPNQNPEPQSLPCEFLAKGCSSLPDRNNGHFAQ